MIAHKGRLDSARSWVVQFSIFGPDDYIDQFLSHTKRFYSEKRLRASKIANLIFFKGSGWLALLENTTATPRFEEVVKKNVVWKYLFWNADKVLRRAVICKKKRVTEDCGTLKKYCSSSQFPWHSWWYPAEFGHYNHHPESILKKENNLYWAKGKSFDHSYFPSQAYCL